MMLVSFFGNIKKKMFLSVKLIASEREERERY